MAWDQRQDFALDTIYVDAADFGSDDPWTVVDSLSRFAVMARDIGGLTSAELPVEVLWNSQMTLYQSHVYRNGH